MIKLTETEIQTNYDIDMMLYETMKWLVGLTKKKSGEFVQIANKIELDQRNWDRFWKEFRRERSLS